MTNNRLKVFLCHASQDKEVVRKMYQDFESTGMEPWLDEKSILPGQDWDTEIQNAIKRSDALLIILSAQSVTKAGYLQKEIKYALDVASEQPEGVIYLIPVRLDECDLPTRLSAFQAADMFQENGYHRLIESLKIRANQLGRVWEEHAKTVVESPAHQEENDALEWGSLTKNFRDAFGELYWDRYPSVQLKNKHLFTTSVVGNSGVGKTSLSWVITGNQYVYARGDTLYIREEETEGPYSYRIPLQESVFIVDHSGFSPDYGKEEWNLATDYINNTSDLILIVTSPEDRAERFRRIFHDMDALGNTPIVAVSTKIDMLKESEVHQYLQDVSQRINRTILPVSVKEGRNLALLTQFILKAKMMYT